MSTGILPALREVQAELESLGIASPRIERALAKENRMHVTGNIIQRQGESLDDFTARVRGIAKTFDFEHREIQVADVLLEHSFVISDLNWDRAWVFIDYWLSGKIVVDVQWLDERSVTVYDGAFPDDVSNAYELERWARQIFIDWSLHT